MKPLAHTVPSLSGAKTVRSPCSFSRLHSLICERQGAACLSPPKKMWREIQAEDQFLPPMLQAADER